MRPDIGAEFPPRCRAAFGEAMICRTVEVQIELSSQPTICHDSQPRKYNQVPIASAQAMNSGTLRRRPDELLSGDLMDNGGIVLELISYSDVRSLQ